MLVFNLSLNPMYLISFVQCSLIKIINDEILYLLSQYNLENIVTVNLLVLISILCFWPQCSKGPIAFLQFTDVSTWPDRTMAFILLG
jgi:hypothetical protein